MRQTIDEVIDRMGTIVPECRSSQSRIGYFAVLYRQVTLSIKKGIVNGEFEDSPRIEILDIHFASRFFKAYDSSDNAGENNRRDLCN